MILFILITILAAMIAGLTAWVKMDPRRYKAEPVGFDPEVERLLEMEDFPSPEGYGGIINTNNVLLFPQRGNL